MFATMPPPSSLEMPDLHLPEHPLFSAEESSFMQNFFDSLLQGGPLPEPPMAFNFGDPQLSDPLQPGMGMDNSGRGVEAPATTMTPDPVHTGLIAPRPSSANQLKQIVVEGQNYVLLPENSAQELERLQQRLRAEQEHVMLLQQQIAAANAGQPVVFLPGQAGLDQPPYQITTIQTGAGGAGGQQTVAFQLPQSAILGQPHVLIQPGVVGGQQQQLQMPILVQQQAFPTIQTHPQLSAQPIQIVQHQQQQQAQQQQQQQQQLQAPVSNSKAAATSKKRARAGSSSANLAAPPVMNAADSASSVASVSDAEDGTFEMAPPKRGTKRKAAAPADEDAAPKKRATGGARGGSRKKAVEEPAEDSDAEAVPPVKPSGRGRKSAAAALDLDLEDQKPINKRAPLTEDQKRQNHILSEQRRRDAIRTGFSNLCNTVPSLRAQAGPSSGAGSSKSVILFKAVEYLQRLKTKVARLLQEEESLTTRIQGRLNSLPAHPVTRPAAAVKIDEQLNGAGHFAMNIPSDDEFRRSSPSAGAASGISNYLSGVPQSAVLQPPKMPAGASSSAADQMHLHQPVPMRSLRQRQTQETTMVQQQQSQKDRARQAAVQALLAAQGKGPSEAGLHETEGLEAEVEA